MAHGELEGLTMPSLTICLLTSSSCCGDIRNLLALTGLDPGTVSHARQMKKELVHSSLSIHLAGPTIFLFAFRSILG